VRLQPLTRFSLPDELNAAEPPEARGLRRDEVKLLVADGTTVTHTRFHQLGKALRPGDLLVVNTSGTLAAAVDGTRLSCGGVEPVVVHFSTSLDDGSWVIELRTAPNAAAPMLTACVGEQIDLPGNERITLQAPHAAGGTAPSADGTVRLWRAWPQHPERVRDFLAKYGRPIAYKYVGRRWPLDSYQTVFAQKAGSAEMPSAGRPFSHELVTHLVSSGVLVAPIRLDTGVSSLESHEPPMAERYDVPEATAQLINHVHAQGGRVVAVGTTAVRAVESAAVPDGRVTASSGWTEVILGPDRPARVVDGLITGMHAPDASHLLLLEAVVGGELVQQTYDAALERGYLWHEFGDLCLLLPE
jgi:S-adenosylmethionine:tRNA ribosyltransferase-isomerase